jgi:hypothetical protein
MVAVAPAENWVKVATRGGEKHYVFGWITYLSGLSLP